MLDVLNLVHELEEKGASLRGPEPAIDTGGPKAKGVYKGRPVTFDRAIIVSVRKEGMGATEIAKTVGCKRGNVYKTDPVVLAQLGDAWRLGVQTDVVQGGLAVVFIPNSPNTFSGSVFFVARDRIQRLDVPLAGALRCLERCGVGGGSLLGNLSFAAVAR